MQIIGITGSIGSGKTTVSGLLHQLGFVVYDADKWCRSLYFRHEFLDVVFAYFPECFENGIFNKRLLRQVVFNNYDKLRCLEKLIHPFLKKCFLRVIHRHAGRDVFFIDAALLFEMGWDKYCTYIITTRAPYDVQKQRVISRDHVTAEHFEKIMDVQMDSNTREFLSDFVLDTDRTLGSLKAEIIKILRNIEC